MGGFQLEWAQFKEVGSNLVIINKGWPLEW